MTHLRTLLYDKISAEDYGEMSVYLKKTLEIPKWTPRANNTKYGLPYMDKKQN